VGAGCPRWQNRLPIIHLNMGVCVGHSQMKPSYSSLKEGTLPEHLTPREVRPLSSTHSCLSASLSVPPFQLQQCPLPPAIWRSSSVPMAAASLTSTTVMAMMTVETGRTSLTAVSTVASWEEGKPGCEKLLWWQGTGASWGRSLGKEFQDSLIYHGRSWGFLA
jgi:hypothetical protein